MESSEKNLIAREKILDSIRLALGKTPDKNPCHSSENKIVKPYTGNIIPKRSDLSHSEKIQMFARYAQAVSSTVDFINNTNDVPKAVTKYLASNNLPTNIVMAPDADLDAFPWDDSSMLTLRRGKPDEKDQVSITSATFGFAETGTLLMHSGHHHPSSLNFVCDTHIVILPAERIVGSYEEGFNKIRNKVEKNKEFPFPRTINLITGPSRTADIEQKMELGAHGPRSLHIIILDKD